MSLSVEKPNNSKPKISSISAAFIAKRQLIWPVFRPFEEKAHYPKNWRFISTNWWDEPMHRFIEIRRPNGDLSGLFFD